MEKEKKYPSLMLTVKVRLEQVQGREMPDVMVYAFDRSGQFITSAPLPKDEQGEVKLKLPQELLGTTVRVILGPTMAEEPEEMPSWMAKLIYRGENLRKVPLPAVLLRRGAYEKRAHLRTESQTLEIAVFPPDWTRWLHCSCVVRGRLVRRLTLPDGTAKELGVCYACVKIYEVDKFPKLILRLPERDLFRLRDDLRFIIEKRLPEIRVWPPPPPPPPIQTRIAGQISKITRTESMTSGIGTEEVPQIELETETAQLSTQIQAELEPIFMATSAIELRNVLVAKADILVRFACILEWLYSYFHTDLIKCVCTDEQGRFETTIWYPCAGDKPDLYFKAVQCIGGTLHTLYDPGVACNTYWNYECGSEVILEVTDPAARVCVPPPPVDPPPGVTLWVMPYAVGGIRLDKIKQPSGLTDYGGIVDAPFGGRLGFRHGYSSAIPINSPDKPFYYRWLYKKDGDGDWYEFAEPVAETVVRHYVDVDLSKPDEPPTFPVYTLGPHSIKGMHLYEFKPHKPPEPPGHETVWPIDDWFGDIYTGILKSPSLPGGVDGSAGKYKVKLEIYDPNGNRIAPGPGTFRFIVPTGLAADGVTIESRDASPTEIEDDGFIFYLHVDNRNCCAIIDAPTIGGVSAGDVCGFLRYTPGDPTPVHIAFHALHPANFATFNFQIKRSAALVSSASGEVAASTVGVYTGDGCGNFEHDFSKGDLLGKCDEAAFAERLWVYAKATNGWVRLDNYDDHDWRAFALAPKKKGD